MIREKKEELIHVEKPMQNLERRRYMEREKEIWLVRKEEIITGDIRTGRRWKLST